MGRHLILSRRDFVRAAGLSVAALAAGPSASDAATRSFALITTRSRAVQQPGLLIRGGTIVTAESNFRADVRIRSAEIVEIANRLAPDGERVIDADGLLVLPGGIDPHAHLTQDESTPPQYRLADDLLSGSQAALAGGVTTIGNMSFPAQGQTLFEAIERDERFVEQKAIADIMLHPVLRDPTQLSAEGIADLVQAGHTSIKIFMVSAAFDQNVGEYVGVMRKAGAAGMLNVIHCEDATIIAEATRALVSSGNESLRYYADSRPLAAEIIATRRAIAYSEATGAPVYFVHVSANQPLQICREAQAAGTPVYVETRPVYLHLTAESYSGPSGPLYVAQPPLRTTNDILALWEGLADGAVHTLGTDHVGWSLEQKMDPSLTIEDLRPGVPKPPRDATGALLRGCGEWADLPAALRRNHSRQPGEALWPLPAQGHDRRRLRRRRRPLGSNGDP